MSILVVGSVALDTVETPFSTRENVLGGAASYFVTAASLYAPVQLVAVVGSDFPQEHLDLWRKRGVNLDGLRVEEGPTFRWTGRYHMDMNLRETLATQLGVYEQFHPVLSDKHRESDLLFLANIHPALQMEVLEQMPHARLKVLHTMELWITTTPDLLTEVIKRVDVLVVSEEEVRQYTEQPSILTGVRHLLNLGPQYVIVKQGSYGAQLFGADGSYFNAPSYPLQEVVDPTGAGDVFAAGFMGHLSTVQPQGDGRYLFEDLKRAVVHGNIIGSFVCEDFSIDRLRTLTTQDIMDRYQALVVYSHFHPEWQVLSTQVTVIEKVVLLKKI